MGNRMSEMTKYDRWYEEESRTVRSRGIVFSKEEMVVNGIVEVINYRALIDDGMSDQDRMATLVRRGIGSFRPGPHGSKDILDICEITKAVLVDTAIKMAGTNPIRVYSGIVFINEWAMHIFVMRRKLTYPNLLILPRLSN